MLLRDFRRFGRVDADGKIPQHVHRNARAAAGELVHDAGVFEFFVDRARGGRLQKFPEARAGVGVTPAWRFDVELIEQREELIAIHGSQGCVVAVVVAGAVVAARRRGLGYAGTLRWPALSYASTANM